MAGDQVADGAVAQRLLQMLVDLMIRRQVLTPADLEHMVACLSMEAHRLPDDPAAAVSREGADTVRAWLLETGDDVPKSRRRPSLKLVKDDKPQNG